MSEWGNISRPLVVVITAALVSMTAISSLIIYTSEQTTQSNIELAATQALRNELQEEARHSSEEMSVRLKDIEMSLSAPARVLSGLDPESDFAKTTVDLAGSGIERYTDIVVWIDADGGLLYSTHKDADQLVGSDLSGRRFYEVVSVANRPFIGESFQGLDGVTSFVVAVPVPRSAADSSFNGVLAALVPVPAFRTSFLELERLGDARVMLVTSDGTILLHPSSSLQGKNIQDPEVEETLAEENKETIKTNFQLMLQGRSGVLEYREKGAEENLLAYEPVVVDGAHIWTVAIMEPTSAIRGPFVKILEERQSFTIIAIGLVGATSAIFITFILFVNRRLFTMVGQQNARIGNQLSELKTAYERLKEQDVIKDEFINIAAHELRTPVLPIVLSAENLADHLPEDENLKIILRNANRITKLTNDILDVSRIESNTFKLQKQKVNIGQLVEEIVQDARLKLPKDRSVEITFESKLPKSVEEIAIDRGRITQVLANLVENAVNFTEDGTIRVVLEPGGNKLVRIRVIDSGKGIDPAIRERLFGKFVSKSEKAKGTGLGLYLSKAIVEAHGGTITGENNKTGRGATFSFTLPA